MKKNRSGTINLDGSLSDINLVGSMKNINLDGGVFSINLDGFFSGETKNKKGKNN